MGDSNERASHFAVRRASERNFGLVFAGLFAVLFALAAWNGGSAVWIWGPAVMVIGSVALMLPQALKWPNRAWHHLGLMLGKVVAPIVMGGVFFVTLTPIALLMRLKGGDPLRLRWDPSAPTYWIVRTPPGPAPSTMPLQF